MVVQHAGAGAAVSGASSGCQLSSEQLTVTCLAPLPLKLQLIDCLTQLICTWNFIVFHDKARRTQQGNLLTLILIILITMICYDQLKDPDEGVSNWDNR